MDCKEHLGGQYKYERRSDRVVDKIQTGVQKISVGLFHQGSMLGDSDQRLCNHSCRYCNVLRIKFLLGTSIDGTITCSIREPSIETTKASYLNDS